MTDRLELDDERHRNYIPFSMPDIGDAEASAAADAWRSGWVTTGPQATAFEQEFAEFVGHDQGIEAIALNSATAGLHLALEALGVGAGDEVILPTWTFTATAEVVRYLGATPVIVDVDCTTLNIDIELVLRALTPRTKVVVPVHFAGRSVDMAQLRTALAGTGVRIVEDAAHALPSSSGGVRVGSVQHSDVAVFSFYANKTMTTGEGGMVTTRDTEVARRIRMMRLHGIDRDVFDRYQSKKPAWSYDVVAPGYKYNLTDPAAAVGRVQLRRVAEMADRRRELARRYRTELAGLPIELPEDVDAGDEHAWHLFVARIGADAPLTRDAFVQALSDRGVGTSVHFIPLHRLTYWRDSLAIEPGSYPVAEEVFPRSVSLPLFSRMSDDDFTHITTVITESLGG